MSSLPLLVAAGLGGVNSVKLKEDSASSKQQQEAAPDQRQAGWAGCALAEVSLSMLPTLSEHSCAPDTAPSPSSAGYQPLCLSLMWSTHRLPLMI